MAPAASSSGAAEGPRPTTTLALLLLLCLLCAVTPEVASSRSVEKKAVAGQEPDQSDYSSDIFVGGFVYCASTCIRPTQAAPKTGKPVKGAIVGVTCINLYGLKTDFASAYTDAKGYFLVDLQEYDFAEFGVANCEAKLLFAPGRDCRYVSGVNKGHSGAPLGKGKVVGKKRIYTVGPFFTVPNKCASSAPQ